MVFFAIHLYRRAWNFWQTPQIFPKLRHGPPTISVRCFRGYYVRGFVLTESEVEQLTRLLGHAPGSYDSVSVHLVLSLSSTDDCIAGTLSHELRVLMRFLKRRERHTRRGPSPFGYAELDPVRASSSKRRPAKRTSQFDSVN